MMTTVFGAVRAGHIVPCEDQLGHELLRVARGDRAAAIGAIGSEEGTGSVLMFAIVTAVMTLTLSLLLALSRPFIDWPALFPRLGKSPFRLAIVAAMSQSVLFAFAQWISGNHPLALLAALAIGCGGAVLLGRRRRR